MHWQLVIIMAAAVAAAVLSGWIAIRTAGSRGLPGCDEGSGCDAVLTSRWSKLGRFPVAGVSTTVYLTLALLAVFAVSSTPYHAANLNQPLLCLAAIPTGAAIWFVLLQLTALRRFCLYCNAIHFSGLICFVFAVWAIHPSAGEMSRAGSVAVVGVALLIAGQLVVKPRTFVIERVGEPETIDFSAPLTPWKELAGVELSVSGLATYAHLPRQISFINNRVIVNTDGLPVLGSPEARQFIAFVFDYTCTACRGVHELLVEMLARDPDLGVLLLLLPQHPGCNGEVKTVTAGHGQACQYARLSISVWQARPEQHQAYDRFLSTGAEQPPLGIAIRRAQEICGKALDPHCSDDRTDALIRKSIDIYRMLPIKKVPTILFPHSQLAGQVKSAADLQRIVARELRGRIQDRTHRAKVKGPNGVGVTQRDDADIDNK